MNHVVSIFRREFAAYFGQPLAYIVLTIFGLLLAVPSLWFQDVFASRVASMHVPFFWTAAAFLFLVPAVTMRLIAEERSTGSLEILATLPITSTQIVVGKWLAAVSIVAMGLALTLSYPIALASLTTAGLDLGPIAAGYLGLLLMGSAFAAIGVACSAFTRFQILAFLLAFVLCLSPWAMGYLLPHLPSGTAPIVQYFTFEYHFANLARGVIDTRSLVFFISVIAVSLRAAVLTLELRRLS